MAILLPFGNSSFPCQGVDDFNALRPPLKNDLKGGLIAIFVLGSLLSVVGVPVAFYFRNEPMFFRIRPFFVIFIMNMTAIFALAGYLLPNAFPTTFPCELEIISHAACAYLVSSVFGLRALIFLVESRYNELLQNHESKSALEGNQDARSAVSSPTTLNLPVPETSSQHHPAPIKGVFHALWLCMQLGFFCRKYESFTVIEFAHIRRYYVTLFFVQLLPPFAFLCLGILLLPPYHSGCVNCPMSLQFLLVVMLGPVCQDVPIVSFVYMALKKIESDPQHICKELVACLVFAASPIVLGYLLELLDPNQVHFWRSFSWRFVLCLGPILYVAFSVFYPAVQAAKYQQFRKAREQDHDDSEQRRVFDVNFTHNNKEEKQAFFQFAASRYSMELLNFVEEVDMYQEKCLNSSLAWKQSQCRRLIRTFIEVGSSQEVNISSVMRNRILETKLSSSNDETLSMLFQQAQEEVALVLSTGLWIDFQNEKRRKLPRPSKVSRAVASISTPE